MSIKMEAEYKGYRIKWEDYGKGFEIYLDTEKAKKNRCQTVEECEKWIDGETKKKFQRVKIIARGFGYNDAWQAGEATSLADDGYVWIVSKKGDRKKANPKQIVLDTPENRGLFDIIKEKRDITASLRKEEEELFSKMTYLTSDMMVEQVID
jgi:hypothetical protein